MLQRNRLEPALVRELLNYDPQSGALTWRIKAARCVLAGWDAGHIGKRGERRVRIDGKTYQATGLIWVLMTGKWPSEEIDHIDRNRSNNQWDNLRLATRTQNGANRKLPKDRKGDSQYRGVYRSPTGWFAAISVNNKSKYLGLFVTEREAAEAYDRAAWTQFGEFAQLNELM